MKIFSSVLIAIWTAIASGSLVCVALGLFSLSETILITLLVTAGAQPILLFFLEAIAHISLKENEENTRSE